MTQDNKYNGWTNYATWRINLEIFDGFDLSNLIDEPTKEPIEWIAEQLADHAEQIIFDCSNIPQSLAMDYARAFLQDVNWHEIAKHLIADYAIEEQ